MNGVDPAMVASVVVFAALFVGATVFVFRAAASGAAFGRDEPEAARERADERVPHRGWWTSTAVWIVIAAGSLALGLWVAPYFLGGPFLFLPFVWRGARSR